jgi:hypothetical protein
MVSRVSDKYAAFIEKTKTFWQPYSPYPLTDDDAEEIIHNVAALFTLLAELDGKYKAGEPAESKAELFRPNKAGGHGRLRGG